MQRPLRGSRISSFYPVKSLPQLSSLDSAFQLQEYISLLIRLDVHDVERIIEVPGKKGKEESSSSDSNAKDSKPSEEQKAEDGSKLAEDKEGKEKDTAVDEYCWIYEHLRRLAQDLTHPLITMLQQECNRSTCPEMKAGEWLYLCVAHGNDGAMEQCCAIDYILHTIDSATALLNSPRAFPSRLSIPHTSHRHFSSLARRLGRVFAHAYYHHREVFEQAEAESSLYRRFLRLTERFGLVPREFLVIPGSGEPNTYETRGESTEDVAGGKMILGKEVPYEQAYPTWSRVSPQSFSESHELSSPSHHQQEHATSLDSPLDPDTSFSSVGPPGLSTSSGNNSPSPPGSGFARTGRSRTDTMVLHAKEDKEPPVTSTTSGNESSDRSSESKSSSSLSAPVPEPQSVPPASPSSPQSLEPTEPTEQVEVKEVKEEDESTKKEDSPSTLVESSSTVESSDVQIPSQVEAAGEVKQNEEVEVTPSSSTALRSSEEQVESEIASSDVPVEAKLSEVPVVNSDSGAEAEGTTGELEPPADADPVAETLEETKEVVEKVEEEKAEDVASTEETRTESEGGDAETEAPPRVQKEEELGPVESSEVEEQADTNPPVEPAKVDEEVDSTATKPEAETSTVVQPVEVKEVGEEEKGKEGS
ncbi:hypothetical protein E1B28_002772 [Marasmius oreades]|uniref:Mob1/phocein n=1 Tax=Marasmius oreades TaxID=181124 RepID=A0A9P7UNE8_9AGAR|nr:uncharacterized protein E1B28_002772 [Marasmius oreades]KAG7086851.1 hypothetical protein E1B28_002772 [Marasmius oreades]